MFSKFARGPWSLKLRLVMIFIAGSFSTLAVATAFMYFAFRHEINVRNHRLLDSRLQDVASVLAKYPGNSEALQEEVLGELPSSLEGQIQIRVLKDDRICLESPGMTKWLPPDRFAHGPRVRIRHHRYILAEQQYAGYRIQGALDTTEDERIIHTSRQRAIYTLLIGVAACSALGLWSVHRGLKPLQGIATSANRITASNLERLDPGQVPQELRELVSALNAMLDRLDHAFDRLSRFSADLAHELRTPITNLMGEAEVALSKERPSEDYRQVLESSMEEFRRLSRLISRMLFLARAEDPVTAITPVTVDGKRLLGEVLAYFEAAAEEQGVKLSGEASGTFLGDPVMLRQALANLVSNALQATPRGGEVCANVGILDNQVFLEVVDTGRGIPAEDLPRVFNRFFKMGDALEGRHSGTGLGLAIVQSIAVLHGGEVKVASDARGTKVSIHFPGGAGLGEVGRRPASPFFDPESNRLPRT